VRAKAVLWSRRAADLAIGRYEIDQGLTLLHGALGLENDAREQAATWRRIGQACALRYDGQGSFQAMQKALEISGPSAEVYADLALQTVQRAGMWVQQPDMTLVDGWIQRALELAEEGGHGPHLARRANQEPAVKVVSGRYAASDIKAAQRGAR
jgi:hypothetical protein